MKKIILFLFLLCCSSSLIYPVIIVRPQQNNDAQAVAAIGQLIGTSICLIAYGVAANKAKKAQDQRLRNIQKSHLEATFTAAKKHSLKELIGPPVKETKGKFFVLMIFFLLFSALLLAAFLTIRKQYYIHQDQP